MNRALRVGILLLQIKSKFRAAVIRYPNLLFSNSSMLCFGTMVAEPGSKMDMIGPERLLQHEADRLLAHPLDRGAEASHGNV